MTTGRISGRLPFFTDRLALGDQGLRVSPFCLGHVREPDTVLAAFDAGINFFFITADMHWPTYEGTREGVRRLLARRPEVRDQFVVAGVCYQWSPIYCHMPFEQLLAEIPGLDHLDVLVAGTGHAKEYGKRLPVYQEHRRDRFLGARAIGTSFHDRPLALSAIRDRLIDIAFIRYNPAHPGALKDLFPHLNSVVPGLPEPATGARTLVFNFKSTVGYAPPSQLEELGWKTDRSWHPEITDLYRFALTRPEIDGILMKPQSSAEVEGIGRALARGPLTPEQEAYLLEVGARLDIEMNEII
jgi:hypothetical protein